CLIIRTVAAVENESRTRQRPEKTSRQSRSRVPELADDLTVGPAEERLLATLKTVRTAIAREEHVPPYIVFSDRTLTELAVRRPRSLRAFQEVRGVGPMKLERYGERFLNAISKADDIEAA